MLADAETEGNEHIFSWFPNGTSFRIHNRAKFISTILPKYYYRINVRSFLRQLNLYGFERETERSSPEFGAYRHKFFILADPSLSSSMKRTASSSTNDNNNNNNNNNNSNSNNNNNNNNNNKKNQKKKNQKKKKNQSMGCETPRSVEEKELDMMVLEEQRSIWASGASQKNNVVMPLSVPSSSSLFLNYNGDHASTVNGGITTSLQHDKNHHQNSVGSTRQHCYSESHQDEFVAHTVAGTFSNDQHNQRTLGQCPESSIVPASPAEEEHGRFRRVLAMFLSEQDATAIFEHGTEDFILENDDNKNKVKLILDSLEPLPLQQQV
jgi:hypothetical protein